MLYIYTHTHDSCLNWYAYNYEGFSDLMKLLTFLKQEY